MLANAQQARQRELEQEYLLQHEQDRLLQERLAQQQQLQQHLLQQQQQQRLREEEVRQRLLFQEQQQQQQAHVQRLLQQQREQQLHQQRTPPPRMIPSSQSPRFLEHHRQLLLLQQQQLDQQLQQQRLHEIEEQLRLEEVERRLLAMNMERSRGESPYGSRRSSAFPVGDSQEVQQAQLLQLAQERQLLIQQQQQQQYRRQRSRSPAVVNAHYPSPLQDEGRQSYQQPQTIQLQQRLLADLAHSDFPRDIHGTSQAEQEALRVEAMRKILEAEKMEEKRRRKAAKIAHMVCYLLFLFCNAFRTKT